MDLRAPPTEDTSADDSTGAEEGELVVSVHMYSDLTCTLRETVELFTDTELLASPVPAPSPVSCGAPSDDVEGIGVWIYDWDGLVGTYFTEEGEAAIAMWSSGSSNGTVEAPCAVEPPRS